MTNVYTDYDDQFLALDGFARPGPTQQPTRVPGIAELSERVARRQRPWG